MTQRTVAVLGLLLSSIVLAACSGPEARLARYLERSATFFAEQSYDKARIEVSNALQIDPNNASARIMAGRVAEKQFKLGDAVANYQAAIEIDKDNLDARAALGRIYLMGGLTDRAKEVIAPALQKTPGDARLLTISGGLKAVEGDTVGALADAEAAVKADPQDEVALALLAAQYGRQNRAEEAIVALQKGIDRMPESVDLRLILAELQNQAGRKEQAEEQLKIIADRHRTRLASWEQLARFYLLEKNAAGAEQAVRDAVKYNPESIEAKNALVALLANQKGAEAAQAQMLEFVKAEPKRAELKVALGQFYEASRKLAEAESTYREVIASEGTKARGLEARNRLAALLAQRSDAPAAEKLIKEVLAESPRDNDALILRAAIAMSRGETSAAITDLRAVLRDQPNSQPLMRALARAHLQDRDTSLAEEVLRNAVQVNPVDQPSRYELAALLAQTRREKLAVPLLESLVKDAPENMGYREALFRIQIATDDITAARATADDVKRLQPNLEQGYVLSGTLFEHERNFNGARSEYEVALQKSHQPVQVLTALVRVELAEKQPKKAADRLMSFLEKTPGDALANQLLGEVRLSMNDYPAALAGFDRAIVANPKWWLPYRGKAMTHDAARHPELALQSLEEGLAKTGSLELGVELASRQDRLGQHDTAIKTYEQLLASSPKSMPVANNLAMLLINRRNDAASLERADKIVGVLSTSEDAPFLDTRGWIKFRRGDLQAALPLLQQAAAKSPQSPEIRYHLGMAQYRSGNKDAARQSLEMATASKSSFTGMDEARATLAAL